MGFESDVYFKVFVRPQAHLAGCHSVLTGCNTKLILHWVRDLVWWSISLRATLQLPPLLCCWQRCADEA